MLLFLVLNCCCLFFFRDYVLSVRIRSGNEGGSRDIERKWIEVVGKVCLFVEIFRDEKVRILFVIFFKYGYFLLF